MWWADSDKDSGRGRLALTPPRLNFFWNFGLMPTLRLIRESKLAELMRSDLNSEPPKVVEASGVTLVDGQALVVLDNDCRVAQLNPSLQQERFNYWFGQRSPKPLKQLGIRGFEGVTWDDDAGEILAVVEAAVRPGRFQAFYAMIVHMDRQGLLLRHHWLDPPLERENKGVEGVQWLRACGRRPATLLTLCEASRSRSTNTCSIHSGQMQSYRQRGVRRLWTHHASMPLPATLDFKDYSDLAVNETGRTAIVSQESSRVWVGQLDLESLRWCGKGECWDLPRSKKGKRRYNQLEGVCWMGDELLLVSDQADKGQPKRVRKRAESIHHFSLPSQTSNAGSREE